MTTSNPRGRKPIAAAEKPAFELNHDQLAADNQAATALVLHQEAIDLTYGEGLAYERERVVHEAQFFMSQSAEAMLEAGKRLILIKENEAHGDFARIVAERLGLGERSARQMMQAAVKYLSPRLEAKRQSIAVLGRSKLFDLMTESDEDIEALADGGTLAGHTLDEIETMTRRELQAAIRDHRQQLDAKDQVLADRNAKIDRLEQRLHRPSSPARRAPRAPRPRS